ncbi:MAG: hypothetical protein IJU72_02600 [Bacteroidales bacterium]|nr:hypothetical protein [Bacteroidales bacterium]
MKRTATVALMALMLGTAALSSCKGPESEVDVNIINYNNTSFQIAKGYKHRVEELKKKGLFKYNVYVMSDGVNLDADYKPTGSGSLISFTVYSKSGFDISQGEYPLDGWLAQDSITAENCNVWVNYDFAADHGEMHKRIKWGSFKFSNLGSTIKIKFNLQDKPTFVEPMDTVCTFRGNFYGVLGDLNK